MTENNTFARLNPKKWHLTILLVWVLIIAIVVFLFGANKIPGLAKAFGQAKKEFDTASKGTTNTTPHSLNTLNSASYGTQQMPPQTAVLAPDDPLVVAAQREGIDTQGKTREQIASELSWKLNRK